ncbi:MAG: helix-turn-helix transcriptional regulator [Clostridia bacterium]|nr:helix-turn-helix transcriptional regulator [Clostridia bacterium]
MRKVADYKKMGERIKEARRNAKVTQVQLAAACDCDPKHISAIENGTKNPSLDLLLIASEELNVSLEFLLKDSPHENTDYYIPNEFGIRLRRMNHQTRMSLLSVMDVLLEMQSALSIEKEQSK